jgi:Ca2+-binding RTX toxin-like protein
MKPEMEWLEHRDLLATAGLIGSTLVVTGTPGNDAVSVYAHGPNTLVDLDFDGTPDFSVPTTQLTGVLIKGLAGDDVLASQPGQALRTVISGGDGDDNISSFAPGELVGGAGDDQIYQIVTPVTVIGGPGRDRLIVSAAATIAGSQAGDDTAVIFGLAAQPVQLVARVVYLAGTAGADSAFVARIGGTLRVTYNGQVYEFAAGDVDVFAGVLGAGNDTFVLGPDVQQRMVAYGGGGNDTLQAGAGDALLKGGADSDVILGGGGNDDLAGSNGEQSAAVDVVDGGGGVNLLRVDATDRIFARAGDLVLGVRRRDV